MIEPKNCQLMIVENAKKNRQTATKISPKEPNPVVKALWVKAGEHKEVLQKY